MIHRYSKWIVKRINASRKGFKEGASESDKQELEKQPKREKSVRLQRRRERERQARAEERKVRLQRRRERECQATARETVEESEVRLNRRRERYRVRKRASLVPRPRPAFRRLKSGKAVEGRVGRIMLNFSPIMVF